jgi:hypothetical protein
LGDLYVAYRNAKVEAYYENTHVHALAFTEYEQHLQENLLQLHRMLLDVNDAWTSDLSFLGGYTYLPKSIDTHSWDDGISGHFRALDPLADWERRFEESGQRATAKLRLIICPSVNFQIISSLWIIKVGRLLDGALNPDLCFANRLRRRYSQESWLEGGRSEINVAATGLFAPYFSAYRNWREQGLSAMEESLVAHKNILAITMDIEEFYHRVSPRFMMRRRFLSSLGLQFSRAERTFTRLLLDAIDTWYRSTPDCRARPQGAIPVGLSASKIIANVLLADLDNAIDTKVKPLYYGRYVDDIFLVFENDSNLIGASDVVAWLAGKLKPLLSVKRNAAGPHSLQLKLPYARDSELVFAGTKQRIFALSSAHGLDLIQHIREQMRAQSSEYRLLPAVPETGAEMASKALLAGSDATRQVDALRKADAVSIRRLGFSLLLRDIETYASDLQPRSWLKVRNEFYGLVSRHVLTPAGFFDFVVYLPRIFGLMLGCGDFEPAELFISKFVRVREILERTSTIGVGTQKLKFALCCTHYAEALRQTALQAATGRRVRLNSGFLAVLKALKRLDSELYIPDTVARLEKLVNQILLADWGSRPYKDFWYLSQTEDEPGPPVPKPIEVRRKLRLGAIRRFRKLAGDLKVPHWPALAFPTRPLRPDEISLAAPGVLLNPEVYRAAIMALRGAMVTSLSRLGMEPPPPPSGVAIFNVPARKRDRITVALASYRTTEQQWEAAVRGQQDRSLKRYSELNQLINRILQEATRPDYIVLPELSIPLRWALRIARKLASNTVSFLAGVEYHRNRKKAVLRNDCLVSLITSWPGYSSHVVRLQPKFAPAYEERRRLRTLDRAKKRTLYYPTGILAYPTLYVHGGYCFSVLICSDLTNITHRNALRGELDTLFILEWNSDVKTFSSLVEATAFDLHTFVVQVNNRLYGDSRVRAPAKAEYLRDVVQVKGGISDYFVLGEIDYRGLRKEQRGDVTKPVFKPMPIGFRMSDRRRKVKS